jgi:hypothetical protein
VYLGEEPSPTKPFPHVQNLKKGFVGEGSSPEYTGRTFKGFVGFFIRFLKLWALLEISGTFFRGSVKHLFFYSVPAQ